MTACAQLSEVLSAYLDGEETADEAVIARSHLESCASCRIMVDDWTTIESAIVLAELDDSYTLKRPEPRRHRPRVRLPLLVAAAIAASAITAGSVFAAHHSSRTRTPTPGAGSKQPVTQSLSSSGATPVATASATPSVRPEHTPRPASATGTDGQLALALAIEDSTVPAGRAVSAHVMLANAFNQPVSFDSRADSPIDVVVMNGSGAEIYRRSWKFSKQTRTRTLDPGEKISELVRFTVATPGTYTVFAECLCTRSKSPSPTPSPTLRDSQPTQFFAPAPSGSDPFDTGFVRLTVTRG